LRPLFLRELLVRRQLLTEHPFHNQKRFFPSAATGRPAYHPATLLKIYLYGYLNRVQSSRRLEREAQRNIELMWLTGRLAPEFKTIADFRKNNGAAIRAQN
jgi:transposase